MSDTSSHTDENVEDLSSMIADPDVCSDDDNAVAVEEENADDDDVDDEVEDEDYDDVDEDIDANDDTAAFRNSRHIIDSSSAALPLMPYQFEPVLPTDTQSNDNIQDATDKPDRLTDFNWCTCGECSVMATANECLCCRECEVVVAKCQEVEDLGLGELPTCITKHPGFESVCLNVWNLQAVYMEYKQQYGDMPAETNEKFRYSSYRHFVRWCWGFIGKQVRVVLPACVVTAIRCKFPAEEGAGYRGFMLPTLK